MSLYYALYVAARAMGEAQGASRLRALGILGRLGFSRRPAVVRTADGLTFELDIFAACYLVKEILHDRTYEHDPAFRPRPGWTVLDVGGHQGIFTIHASRLVGPQGRVIAVEAFPDNARRLRANIERNEARNVHLVEAAAAEKEGRAALHLNILVSGGQSLIFDNADYSGTIQVPLKTVDQILQELGVTHVDLVKIDVEGAAQRVLDGATGLLPSLPRLVMEIEGGESELLAMTSRLQSAGYTVRAVGQILYASATNATR